MPCKDPEARREYNRQYGKDNRTRLRENGRRWRIKHRDRFLAQAREQSRRFKQSEKGRAYFRRYEYQRRLNTWLVRAGWSHDEYLERVASGWAICKRAFDGSRKVNFDHDHDSGIVRGLLCTRCNTGLGWLETDGRAATMYLGV